MAGEDDDPPWESEFSDLAPTVVDGSPEAVPFLAPPKDSTGKIKTLPGFANAVEQTREHYLAVGEIRGIRKVLAAFRLMRINMGDHPTTARAHMDRLERWMAENDELVRAVVEPD